MKNSCYQRYSCWLKYINFTTKKIKNYLKLYLIISLYLFGHEIK